MIVTAVRHKSQWPSWPSKSLALEIIQQWHFVTGVISWKLAGDLPDLKVWFFGRLLLSNLSGPKRVRPPFHCRNLQWLGWISHENHSLRVDLIWLIKHAGKYWLPVLVGQVSSVPMLQNICGVYDGRSSFACHFFVCQVLLFDKNKDIWPEHTDQPVLLN